MNGACAKLANSCGQNAAGELLRMELGSYPVLVHLQCPSVPHLKLAAYCRVLSSTSIEYLFLDLVCS